jgi:hypothetical protein
MKSTTKKKRTTPRRRSDRSREAAVAFVKILDHILTFDAHDMNLTLCLVRGIAEAPKLKAGAR